MVEQVQDAKIQWHGHAGFKISFNFEGTERIIYIDPWIGNPKYPESLKNEAGESPMPTDADLVLVTHGHFDHFNSAAPIQKASTKEGCKIACGYELGMFLKVNKGIPEANVLGCGMSGTIDLGYAKISMVHADHSSSCGFAEDGIAHYAGAAAGWVIRLANGVSIYHTGDTGVFGDMQIINELYKPTHILMCIGGHFTMGPEEAAYAISKFFCGKKTIIPMHYQTFPILTGDYPAFKNELEVRQVEQKTVVNSYQDLLGKWMELEAPPSE